MTVSATEKDSHAECLLLASTLGVLEERLVILVILAFEVRAVMLLSDGGGGGPPVVPQQSMKVRRMADVSCSDHIDHVCDWR